MDRRDILVTLGRSLIALGILGLLWISFWTFYDPRVEVPPPERLEFEGRAERSGIASVLFLGDFAPTDAATSRLKKHGYGYPYNATRKLLAAHDVVVANLEAPVTDSADRWPLPREYMYKVAPEAVPEMARAGIDIVTLANNHLNDYGRRGIADTLRHLDEGGVSHLGGEMSEAGARRGVVLETEGGRLGVLSYLEGRSRYRLWSLIFALDAPFRKWPGAARLTYADIAEDIARMKRHADAVAVVVHWGDNYGPVTASQRAMGRACVDFGADAVFGHHPHWYQPVAMVKGRPVVYSLGNYAFGTRGREIMRFGMGAALHMEGGALSAIELIPLLTQNRIVKFKPRVPRGERLEQFFEGLIEPSRQLGAEIERRGDRGWLALEEISGGARSPARE